MASLIAGAVAVAIVLFSLVRIQRLKRRAVDQVPGARWQRTDEVIKDPFTDQVVRVWIDPHDGSRHYVPDRFPGRGRR